MLHLKRVTHWNDMLDCDASGKQMIYGDFYYEDDETGKRIEAKYYQQLKDKYRRDNWDQSALAQAKSEKERREMLKKAEQQMLSDTVLDKPVWGKDSRNNSGHVPVNGR